VRPPPRSTASAEPAQNLIRGGTADFGINGVQVGSAVVRGHSNAEIATILFTSVGTVRKHMEHIFDRSGVRSRSAAVARLMPALPRTPAGGWGIGTGSRPAACRV